MLEKMGHSIIVTIDGVEAWDKYEELKPRIIISDWVMPNMDGLELCRRIRKASTDNYTYIIIVTSKSKKVDLIEAFKSGGTSKIKLLHTPLDKFQKEIMHLFLQFIIMLH